MQGKRATEDMLMATLLTLGRRMRQRVAGDELDYSLIPVLKSLWEHGPTRHTALAERLMLDASTVSRKVRHLEERGLVAVGHDEQDGRARRGEILPEGRRVLRQLTGRRLRLISAVLEDWPAADRERLGELLGRLNRGLEAQGAAAEPASQPAAGPVSDDADKEKKVS